MSNTLPGHYTSRIKKIVKQKVYTRVYTFCMESILTGLMGVKSRNRNFGLRHGLIPVLSGQ